MKKIITLFVMFFAFSINASAQDKSIECEISAKKDLELLVNTVTVDNNTHMAFFELFKKKHEDLASPDLTMEKRAEISYVIEAKLRNYLGKDLTMELEKNSTVYAQLIAKVPSTEEATTTKTAKKKK